MSFTRRTLLAGSAMALALFAASAASAQDKIVIGTDAAWKPFGYIDTAGQLAGFDIDISKALCAEMKADCKIENVPWDGLFAALEAGKIDAIITGVNITADRKSKYEMVGPYFQGPLAWLGRANSTIDGSPASLEGKMVGTLAGAAYEEALRQKFGNKIKLKTYDSMDAAVLDLDAGRADVLYGDDLQFRHSYVTQSPNKYKIIGQPIPFGEGKGIVLRKGQTALGEKFQKALDAIVANGKHAEISKKYFGIPLQVKL